MRKRLGWGGLSSWCPLGPFIVRISCAKMSFRRDLRGDAVPQKQTPIPLFKISEGWENSFLSFTLGLGQLPGQFQLDPSLNPQRAQERFGSWLLATF